MKNAPLATSRGGQSCPWPVKLEIMVIEDRLKNFIPQKSPRLIMFGTMVTSSARSVDGAHPGEVFYYHNNVNHFWRILNFTFEGDVPFELKDIEAKKIFLEKHRIGIFNLVRHIQTGPNEVHDSSDDLLFKCHKASRVGFKELSMREKKILSTTPLYFTCRYKAGIKSLIQGYLKTNGLPPDILDQIHFLPSPTRCNPWKRSRVWRDEISPGNY